MCNHYLAPDGYQDCSIYGYSYEKLTQSFYDGPPDFQIAMPPEISGLAHGMAVCPDADLLGATSEDNSDPTDPTINYYERFWHIPTGSNGALTVPPATAIPSGEIFHSFASNTWGARSVALFPDGTTMLSRGGSTFARPTIHQLRGVGNIRSLPTWINNGSSGAITGWDCHITGNASDHLVWHQGWDSLYLNDLNVEPGNILPTKIAKGSNIGASSWGGGIAFDAQGNCYLVQSHLSRIAYFTAEQIDELGPSATNPVPAKVLTTPTWTAINLNFDSIWGVVMDVHGGLYVSTCPFAQPWPKGRVFYIEPDAVEQGGVQAVSRTLVAPEPIIATIRLGLGRGIFLR